MKKLPKVFLLLLSLITSLVIVTWVLSLYIANITAPSIHNDIDSLPEAQTAIILGASVYSNGKLSTILRERVDSGLYLYRRGKVKEFLLSGDNRSRDYDEVSAMRNYLIKNGVPAEHITTDPAGLNTFQSIYRSHNTYKVSGAIVVTQQFHLPRAIFIAQKMGLDYHGYPAYSIYNKTTFNLVVREKLANYKAVFTLISKKNQYFNNITSLFSTFNDKAFDILGLI